MRFTVDESRVRVAVNKKVESKYHAHVAEAVHDGNQQIKKKKKEMKSNDLHILIS